MKNKLNKDFLGRLVIHKQRIFRILRKSVLQHTQFVLGKQLSLTRNFLYHSYILRNHWNHNYCILSGRSRGLITKYKLTRSFFKLYANKGSLYLIKKASW